MTSYFHPLSEYKELFLADWQWAFFNPRIFGDESSYVEQGRFLVKWLIIQFWEYHRIDLSAHLDDTEEIFYSFLNDNPEIQLLRL